jgi:hypothetical protein
MAKVCQNSESYLNGSTHQIAQIQAQQASFNHSFSSISPDLDLVKQIKALEPIRFDNLTRIQLEKIAAEFAMMSFARTLALVGQVVPLLISYSFLLIFVNTFKYYSCYMRDVRFDNECVTVGFRLLLSYISIQYGKFFFLLGLFWICLCQNSSTNIK